MDVRVVAATHTDLHRRVEEGRFRRDLFFRLNAFTLTVPPLRERREDIPALAEHFLARCEHHYQRRTLGFSDQASAAMTQYAWPGNVRELKNAIERSIYRAAEPGQPLQRIHFDPFAHAHGARPEAVTGTTGAAGPDRAAGESLPVDFREVVASLERRLLARALRAADGNRRVAAEMLALSYDQLRGLLRKHDVGGTGRPGRPPA